MLLAIQNGTKIVEDENLKSPDVVSEAEVGEEEAPEAAQDRIWMLAHFLLF